MPIFPQTDLFRTSIFDRSGGCIYDNAIYVRLLCGYENAVYGYFGAVLFPMVVAAGICFAMLNSSALNEAASMLGCFCGV